VTHLVHSVEILSYRACCHITQVFLKDIKESLQKGKDEDRVHYHALGQRRLALKKRTHSLLSQDMRYGRFHGRRDNTPTVLRMNRRTRPDRQCVRGSCQMHRSGRLCVEAGTRHEMYETQTGSVAAYSETGWLHASRAGEREYYPEASSIIIPSIVMVASPSGANFEKVFVVAKNKVRLQVM
jgi:hypothetical protein